MNAQTVVTVKYSRAGHDSCSPVASNIACPSNQLAQCHLSLLILEPCQANQTLARRGLAFMTESDCHVRSHTSSLCGLEAALIMQVPALGCTHSVICQRRR